MIKVKATVERMGVQREVSFEMPSKLFDRESGKSRLTNLFDILDQIEKRGMHVSHHIIFGE